MKKILLPILIVVLTLGIGAVVWAGKAAPGVWDTPHELAPEPCAMCHTPHSGTGEYPLWNRLQVLPDGVYQVYDSISFDMGPANNPPKAPSSLCLVCHNGIASSLVNYPGPCSVTDTAYDLEISGCADLDTNLMDDHPISFRYDIALDNITDDNGFPLELSTATGRLRYYIPGAFSGTKYWLYADSQSTVDQKRFECATCHAVHDNAEPLYAGKGDYQVYFLRQDNTRSTLCKDCHVKR